VVIIYYIHYRMFIHQLFLFVLLISKMAQLKHSKKVVPNDAFIGILIVYLLIQSLTSNTKEFAVPGASTTLGLDEQAWSNLHAIIHQLYSGGILTIPGNVHIKGDLLVGTYKGGGTTHKTYEESKLNAACWNDSAGVEHQPPEVGTGGIYAWTAAHQETLTTFIYRARPDNAYQEDDIWFCSRAEFKNNNAAVMQTIKCGDLHIRSGKAIYTDLIASAGSGWVTCRSNMSVGYDGEGGIKNLIVNGDTDFSSAPGKVCRMQCDLHVDGNTYLNSGVKVPGIKAGNFKYSSGSWLYMSGSNDDVIKCNDG